ncbi:MAG: acyl-CoA dehydrogenase family protein [Proteobacteria bacterium]|nr:acyl-CoA dehydrogenase family protein [Pseudomonadota bacterium]
MPFLQAAPVLSNQYLDDRVLRSYLRRILPRTMLGAIEPDLTDLGEYAANAWALARAQAPAEPTLTQWDVWGERVDRIELTPAWIAAQPLAARHGLVAAGHETTHGTHARVHQFALVYLFHCASEFYTCPLAMTDGAATALKASGNQRLIDRALPHLLSRDPEKFWISGQWMTENVGGSDVSATETIAREENGRWRLYGRKWFTSAINAQAALALARPAGAPAGSDALALFYLEPRKSDGRWRNVTIDRLKDKLGTRQLPTAEIHLDGTPAELVGEPRFGVRQIAPVLNITRTWNAIGALATMRRCIALVRDYGNRRVVFGKPLAEQLLFQDTLAGMQAEFEAAFHLAFFVTELLGRVQCEQADDNQKNLLRLLTPLAKLWTGKLAVAIASETCECIGGVGYLEDSGVPQLLRDAQVWPIWEGASNVQALDFQRALRESGGLQSLLSAQRTILSQVQASELEPCARAARMAATAIAEWLQKASAGDRQRIEAGGRELAFGLARMFALTLLARHAEWALRAENDPRPAAAARRFAEHRLLRLKPDGLHDAQILASDSY